LQQAKQNAQSKISKMVTASAAATSTASAAATSTTSTTVQQVKQAQQSTASAAAAPKDLEHLIYLRVAWKERCTLVHFCENATDGPNVDCAHNRWIISQRAVRITYKRRQPRLGECVQKNVLPDVV
jgi:hypothetical protein